MRQNVKIILRPCSARCARCLVWIKGGLRWNTVLKDTVITGLLDYAYVASTGLFTPIVSIIEATDGKIVHGRAQNYVQLLSCYDLAQKSYLKLMAAKHRGVSEKQLLKDFSLCTYGVVSSVSEWLFVRFDGKEWLETSVIPVTPNFEADRENIKKILTILYSILMHQSECAHKLGNDIDKP
jgi:hypothetical protein